MRTADSSGEAPLKRADKVVGSGRTRPSGAEAAISRYALAVNSRIVGGLIAVALIVAACGGSAPPASPDATPSAAGGPSVIPYIVTLEQAVGPNRLLFTLLDPDTNASVAAPDLPVSVAFTDPAGVAGTAMEAPFIWAIEDSRGVYVVKPTFGSAGTWKAAFTTAGATGAPETIVVSFDVREDGTTVAVGEQAPSVKTPTLADVGGNVGAISTDKEPTSAFYERSVDELLAAKTPFVLVFATPKFCTSAQCGPTLERVKAVAAQRPDFTIVNVEPYELDFTDGALQARRDANGQLQAVPASDAYGLVTEPWIFVIDGSGTVTASLEGIFTDEELLGAIDAAT